MPLIDQIDKVTCGAGDYLGTGSEACKFIFEQTAAIMFADGSYVQTDEISLANLRIAQQKESIFVINEIEKFTQVEVAPIETTTEGTGLKSIDAEYPYEFEFEFKNKGFYFWKALRKFNSTNSHSVAFIDKNGNTLMTMTGAGAIKFFKASLVHTGQIGLKQGTNPEMVKMKIQLRYIKEMENAVWVTSDESSLDVEELDGWNDVIFTPSPLLTGETTLTVKATLSDKSHFASGLVLADFLVKKDGVVVTHTAVVSDENAKTYALTIPASSAGVYTITTTNTYSKGVVLQSVTGVLLKANVATVIVA